MVIKDNSQYIYQIGILNNSLNTAELLKIAYDLQSPKVFQIVNNCILLMNPDFTYTNKGL
jgi:hypothetical protein